jgi:hypothetical protein
VILTNTGNASLVLDNASGITIAGPNAGDYMESNNCETSVAANSTCTISVSFAPTASGTRNATIRIISNALTSPDMIGVIGVAN